MNFETCCPNMNHSRPNAPVQFCPSCGKAVSTTVQTKCDDQKHALRRRDRDLFCVDCGLSLRKL